MDPVAQKSGESLKEAQQAWLKKLGVIVKPSVTDVASGDAIRAKQTSGSPSTPGDVLDTAGNRATPYSASPDDPAKKSLYEANLSGIEARLQSILKEKPPDDATAAIHQKIKDINQQMRAYAADGDYNMANQFSDELLVELGNYEKAREANTRKTREVNQRADARGNLEKKYNDIEKLLNDVLNTPPIDSAAADFAAKIEKLKQEYNSARLSDDINSATKHLDNIIRELNAKLAEVSAAYSKNVADIAWELESGADSHYYPSHPLDGIRKQLIAARKNLSTISSYINANKLVGEFKRKQAEYKKQQAAVAKDEPKQKEAAERANAKFKAELTALKAALDKAVDHPYPPAGDDKSREIYDQLEKIRKDWDAALKNGFPFPSTKWGSAFPSSGVKEIKELFQQYQSTTEAFWKKSYETAAAQMKADLPAALDKKKWTDDAMKVEQSKIVALKKEMDAAVGKKDYYQASIKASALFKQLHRFKSLIYRPDMVRLDGLKPRVLGKPVTGPAATTLLMLLNKTGDGPTDDPNGVNLNNDGLALLAEWEGFSKVERDWTKDFELIQKNTGKGAADLKQIQKVKDAIAAGTRGGGGKDLREAIEKYSEAVDDIEIKLGQLKSKRKLFEVAASEQIGANLARDKKDKNREVNKKQGDVQAEEKRIQDLKSKAGYLVGLGASIVTKLNPARFAISVGVFVGEQLFEAAMPTGDLEKLQKELNELKAELEKIEDAEVLNKIITAGLKYENAEMEIDIAIKELDGSVHRAELAQTTLVEAMEKSAATAGAGKVIEKRGDISKAAEDAQKLINQYLKDTEPFAGRIGQLGKRYQDYASAAMGHGRDPYMNWVYTTATANGDTLDEFKSYIESVQTRGRNALTYLAKTGGDSYFAGYDKMPRELQDIVKDRNKPTKPPK
jgi:hypothetical protein